MSASRLKAYLPFLFVLRPDESILIKGKVLIIATLTARSFCRTLNCLRFPIPGKVYIIYDVTDSGSSNYSTQLYDMCAISYALYY